MPPVEEIGHLTLGACVPSALAAQVTLDANLAIVLPKLQAQLAGALEAQARLGIQLPTIAARIEALLALVAQLEASLEVGVSLDLSVMAAFVAQLQLELGQLQAQLAASVGLGILLGTPGVWAYSRSGPAGTFGTEFQAELSGGLPDSLDPNLPTYAVVFIASDGGAIEAMKQVFVAV